MSNLNSDIYVCLESVIVLSKYLNMLSKASEHGIKAMICITKNTTIGERINIGEISNRTKTPEAYTSKIMQRLVKAGLVESKKGAKGGFLIENRLLHKLTAWDVVNELDGASLKDGCILGLEECSSRNPCSMHTEYKSIREGLIDFLQKSKLALLAEKADLGTKSLIFN